MTAITSFSVLYLNQIKPDLQRVYSALKKMGRKVCTLAKALWGLDHFTGPALLFTACFSPMLRNKEICALEGPSCYTTTIADFLCFSNAGN